MQVPADMWRDVLCVCVPRAWRRTFGLRLILRCGMRGRIWERKWEYDLMGINQNLFGARWEIGAYVYVPEGRSGDRYQPSAISHQPSAIRKMRRSGVQDL